MAMRRCCGIVRGATPYQLACYRGVSVCLEWLSYATFEEWAFSHGWRKGLYLTRKDKSGDFCPENCIWTTLADANGYRRCVRRLPDGRSARDILGKETLGRDGVEHIRLAGRLFGWYSKYKPQWSVEEALHIPKCSSSHMARRERAQFRAEKQRTDQ